MNTRGRMSIQVAAFTSLALVLATVECQAVRPYTPLHPDPVLEPWRWRSFPELQGLGLQCMEEDKDGNMWFGGSNGVVRYDGMSWKTYTSEHGLPGESVSSLCATRNGDLYAGTEMGISRFSDGVWVRVFPTEDDLKWNVWDLMEGSDGSLWAGTEWGAVHLSENQVAVYTNREEGAALQVQRSKAQLFVVPDEAFPHPRRFQVYDVFEDQMGRMWFGMWKGDVVCFDIREAQSGNTAAWKFFDKNSDLNSAWWPRVIQTKDQCHEV